MADVLFIGVMVGFFALAVVLVRACDRIVGVDDPSVTVTVAADEDTVEAAA